VNFSLLKLRKLFNVVISLEHAAYDDSHVTVEPFCAADFVKYINNDVTVPDKDFIGLK